MHTHAIRWAVSAAGALALGTWMFAGMGGPAAHAQEWRTASAAKRPGGTMQVMHVDGIDVVPVQGNVYMLVGAGANLVASVGEEGVLLVDTGTAEASEQVIAAVRALSPDKPLQYIINTQAGVEHTGGNDVVAASGRRLVDRGSTQAVVLAHENVLNRMVVPPDAGQERRPVQAWPTDTFFVQTKEVYFNGEPVILHHHGGTTDGDTFVFFRTSDVIAAGDLFMTTTFPPIDLDAGGHVNNLLEGLNHIVELSIPANNVEDGTLVVSGHGRLVDEFDVAVYRDMVTIVRDRVQDAIDRGLTLEQVQADERIVLEYGEQYGSTPGPGSTEMFLGAVYDNLSRGGM